MVASPGYEDAVDRIAELKAKLAGRTDSGGKPKKGYTRNVQDIKAEIARLEASIK